MITNRWGEKGGWGANEMTKGGVTIKSHKYLLTSLNLSHRPTSHLSSKKLPLSERAETRPKATAHTHSKATLSICGHTTTTRREDIGSDWRTPHSRNTPIEALRHASQKLVVNTGSNDSSALVSYLVASKAPQTVCARCRFLSLVIAVLSLSLSRPLSLTYTLVLSRSLSHRTGCLCAAENGSAHRARALRPVPLYIFFSLSLFSVWRTQSSWLIVGYRSPPKCHPLICHHDERWKRLKVKCEMLL